MKRWILYLLSLALLYYVALIYNSRSMLYIVCVMFVLEFCLQFYNLIIFRKLHVRVHTPVAVVEQGNTIPVELVILNNSWLPSGQVCVWINISYVLRRKHRRVQLRSVVPGRETGQERSSVQMRFELEPRYVGKVEISVKRAYVLDLFGFLPLMLGKKHVRDRSAVFVLPEQQEIPLEIDGMVRKFSLDRETEIRIRGEKNPPEVALIREYQPGDAFRNIHWKLTAKQGDLMVCEHISEQSCPILFFVDLRKVSERFLQVMYSMGMELLRQQSSYYLVYYEKDTGDLLRTPILQEQDLYDFFLQVDMTGQKFFSAQWEEEYREKYRQISYAVKLILRQDLVCTYNDEIVWEEGMNWRDETVEK